MTISSSNRKAGPFTGNGVTVAFPFTFKVFSTADVLVVQALASTGAETVQTLTTNYTVALNADQNISPGGTVTMLVAPSVGYTLTLTSQVDDLQTVDVTNNGGFYPKVFNNAFDKATIQIQQLAEKIGRALKLPVSSTASADLPLPLGGYLLGWKADASGFQNYGPADNSLLTAALAAPSGSSIVTYLPAGTGAVAESVQDALRHGVVYPEQYGAISTDINPIFDSTAALNKAFATGKTVDGNGKTYNVTAATIIDPYATVGVGYGLNKAWFLAGVCQNINFVGDVSFGMGSAFFLGKHEAVKKVTVTGDCRLSSWYTDFQGVIVTGTTYLNGDSPPAINWVGCYYNKYSNCDFNNVIVDQRYGPFNLNNFTECQFGWFLVIDTGNAGYGGGTLPYKDFHLNTFIGCEWQEGYTAPDGRQYNFVIHDSANVGGINRIIGPYQEMATRGFYGVGFEIENIHNSGSVTGTYIGGPAGNNRVGWQSPMSGEGGYVSRDVPHIYPAGQLASGGDWSILGTNGWPMCFSTNAGTPSLVTDAQEPSGLGKAVQFVGSAFGYIAINPEVNTSNMNVLSFAVLYKDVAGSSIFITYTQAGAEVYGAANLVYLDNGWVMGTGHTYSSVKLSSSAGFTVKVGAVSMGRGSGVISPFSNQRANKPLLDLSGGPSYFKDFLNSSGLGVYSNQNTKSIQSSSGTVGYFTITLPPFSGYSCNLRVNFSLASGGGGARQFYRESIIQVNGSNVIVETNLHAISGANGSLSFTFAANVITVNVTTSMATAEPGNMSIQLLGYDIPASRITVL